ncbi:methionine adenosyltransferase [Tessaracoccus sp. ZS01]|uniref:methionine adenosyltransferase n=1 Tax=Tessaracoccus sp. ZS01 TaxID=1906324 RepID=UPI00096F4EFE|nr:methionine adenosyltransferase [Tessaracoccus sp. ZS01]MCG6566534.1 methionine adenosyltransferase [Tessaracoccus sp. ZS01]OMG58968.1 methionine adenosyltransferase [Tessaracoccus sp. ZS01]
MSRLFTSESVTEGHPDKIADSISDAVLDGLLAQDKESRVAVETLVTTGLVVVAGEVSTTGYVDVANLARKRILEIGYDSSSKGFDGASCGVTVAIGAQSPDIAQGVDDAYERRVDADGDIASAQGAGDQGLMFGFACNETEALMPLPVDLAHRLAEQLTAVRKDGTLEYLRPDGKTQVTVRYGDDGRPEGIDTVVVSTQHSAEVTQPHIHKDLRREVIGPVLERYGFGMPERVFINPTGKFVIGGPMGDAGVTGRKIIVDTYGGMARHGGGAFSGKDPSKVDRSAAYATRWVAKNVVAAGLAERCEVQVAYAIGKAHPVGFYLDTFGTNAVPEEQIRNAVLATFDLRPGAIIRDLDLLRPIYSDVTVYGHFGRNIPSATWERTDRVDALAAAVKG